MSALPKSNLSYTSSEPSFPDNAYVLLNLTSIFGTFY